MTNTTHIKIYSSPPHPELESALLDKIHAIKAENPLEPVVILVGSALLAEYLQWKLAEEHFNTFNIRVITLSGLFRDLSSLFPNNPLPRLPLNGEYFIVNNVLNDMAEDNYFQAVYNLDGFRRAFTGTMLDMDRAGIRQLPPGLSSITHKGKLKAISELRNRYFEIKQAFQTSEPMLQDSHDLREHFVGNYGISKLIIYGIYDLTGLQRQSLRNLSRYVDIDIFIPYLSGDESPYNYALGGLEFFQSLTTSQITVLDQTADNKTGRRLFQYSNSSTDQQIHGSGSLTILQSKDINAEISEIVARINELVLYKNVNLDTIGVIIWNAETYHQPIINALADAQLPAADLIGQSLITTPAGSAASGLVELVGYKLNRKKLIDFLVSESLILSSEPDYAIDPHVWESISLETGIIEDDLHGWMRKLNYLSRERSGENDLHKRKQISASMDEVLRFTGFIENLFGHFDNLLKCKTWKTLTEKVAAYLANFIPAGEALDSITRELDALNVFNDTSITVSWKVFKNYFTRQLSLNKIKSGRYRHDGIAVCDKFTSRGVSFDYVFVPGMVQGSVPVVAREDSILGDGDRNQINNYLSSHRDCVLPLKATRTDEEKLIFSMLADSAKKHLYLSYPLSDQTGSATLPSRFLLEICRVIEGRPVASEEISGLEYCDSGLSRGLVKSDGTPFTSKLTDPGKFLPHWIEANIPASQHEEAYRLLYSGRSQNYNRIVNVIQSRRFGTTLTDYEGIVGQLPGEQDVLKLGLSGIERYAKCPYQFFVLNKLALEPLLEPELSLIPSPADIGSIIHKILQRFFEITKQKNKTPLTPVHIPWASQLIESLVNESAPELVSKWQTPGSVWQLEIEMLQQRLKNYIITECNDAEKLPFHSSERDFSLRFDGTKEKLPNQITIYGKIDRLDIASDNSVARLIDYKTGAKLPHKPMQFKGGQNLQLAVYLTALPTIHQDLKPENTRAEYRHIDHNGEVRILPLSWDELVKRKDDLSDIVTIYARGINDGLFPPIPEKEICANCSARSVCDIYSRNGYQYKQGDDRIAAIREVGDIE